MKKKTFEVYNRSRQIKKIKEKCENMIVKCEVYDSTKVRNVVTYIYFFYISIFIAICGIALGKFVVVNIVDHNDESLYCESLK